ncbi:MAG: penicillin-binding transpeptidase domain-containing protein [Chloroflexota bacterium]
MRPLALLCLLLLIITPVDAQEDFQTIFGGYDGTFVIYDVHADVMTIYNLDRALQRFSPYSTYKVPHATIALASGLAPGDTYRIIYDEQAHPYTLGMEQFWSRDLWTQDHTLRSSLQFSIVWYYRELAGQIGQDTMQNYLNQFDYGNRDISTWLGDETVPAFWLGGSLKISAIEQVEWWRALYQRDLGIADDVTDTVLDMALLYEADSYRLYGKTGTRADDLALAWFVGLIEQDDDAYIFALNVEASPTVRSNLLRAILVSQGYMSDDSPLFLTNTER